MRRAATIGFGCLHILIHLLKLPGSVELCNVSAQSTRSSLHSGMVALLASFVHDALESIDLDKPEGRKQVEDCTHFV